MTRNEIISAALAHLKLLPSGQSPAPEDVEAIEGRLDTIAADLAARDRAYVNPDDIADEQFEQFVIVVAQKVAPLFEISTDFAALEAAENALEVIERQGRLVPAVTARDLSLDGAARGLLALSGVAQLRLDAHPMMELPCTLEGRALVCAPRAADAPRAAEELPAAARALVRMSGLGTGTHAGTEPTELRLSGTAQALERLRRAQPPGATPPPPEPGLELRDILNRLRALLG